MRISRTILFILAATAISVSGASPIVSAQGSQPQGQALEIAPPVIVLSGNPGETIRTTINLRDVSSSPLIVTNEVNDFTAAGLDGTPKIDFEETSENRYSLKSWIAPVPQLLLQPRQIRELPVTIRVPSDASPGAHYGVIRFTGTPPDLDGTGVSLSASLGALILLRVSGEAKEELSLVKFSVDQEGKTGPIFEGGPLTFKEQIKNVGNTFEAPTGQVTIKNMFGKPIAAVNINLDKRNVLPDSTREFTQALDKSVIGSKKLFGRYTASLSLKYGTKNQTLNNDISFWVIPYRLIAAGIFLLIVGFFVLRFLIGRYNRRILNQAQKSKSKKKK